MTNMSRRNMLGGLVAGAAASGSMFAAAEEDKKMVKQYPNDHYYPADGAFDVQTAREVYYEMFDLYSYPIPDVLRTDEFWVADFGLGKFTEIGLGGIFWINRVEESYFGHEIYLLPGQSIPEHKHVKTEHKPKMEGWHVRHGSVHIYGEGEPTPGVDERIPPSHRECAVARTEKQLLPGEVGYLGGAEQWHWMKAGDQGAIVTEYGTYHDNAGLRFTHPDVKF